MNTYRVTGARPVLDVEPGDQLEATFSAAEEAEYLSTGRLEIVESEYQNLGTSVVHGAQPGESFRAALTVGQRDALIAGGHIDADSDGTDLASMSREKLNVLAVSAGVEAPEKLSNKQAVIDAINAATEPKEG